MTDLPSKNVEKPVVACKTCGHPCHHEAPRGEPDGGLQWCLDGKTRGEEVCGCPWCRHEENPEDERIDIIGMVPPKETK
jgi:hypothetical protein